MLENLLQLAPKEILSLIFGKLLGDGNLTIEKHRQPRLRFQHCYLDREWCSYCYNSLKTFIPLAPPKKRVTSDLRLIKGYSESVLSDQEHPHYLYHLNSFGIKATKKLSPLKFYPCLLIKLD
jgi:hypothetical protein